MEELIRILAKRDGLKVIYRTSAFYIKGKDVKLRQVGEERNMDNVLEQIQTVFPLMPIWQQFTP